MPPPTSNFDGLNNIFLLSDGPKNWAQDAKVRERIRSEILPLLLHVRSRRMALTTYWQSLFRIWALEHEEQAYQGRANIYVPAGRRIIDTLVANAVAMTFPTDDAFQVEAIQEADDQQALEVKALLEYRLEKAGVRMNCDAFYRLFFLTGNGVYKTRWWEKAYSRMKRTKKVGRLNGNPMAAEQNLFGYQQEQTKVYCGPAADIVHPGNFFAWPENVLELRDAVVVFEDFTRSLSEIRQQAKARGLVKDEVDAIKGDQRLDNKVIVDSMNLVGQGMSSTMTDGARAGVPLVDVTEVYIDFDPKAEKGDSEAGEPVPFLITVTAGGQILRAIENPRATKTHPYHLARLGKVQGRLWGSGIGEALQPLQQLLNDQTNQAMDCAVYSLNPYALYNPNMVLGKLPALEPGIAIPVMDINTAIKWDRPPVEMIQAASVLMSQTGSWMQDYGMSPPVLSGGAAPGRAQRSATGVGTAQTNAMRPLTEIVRSCEKEVWEPMLQDFYALDQQFGTGEVPLMLGGTSIAKKTPAELTYDCTFKWLASQQAVNQQVKSQQIEQLLSIIGSPGLTQALAANGIKANPAPLVERLIREGFGFRDADKILVPMQPGEMQQPGGPGGPQTPGGPGAPGSNPLAGNAQSPEDTSGPFGATRVEANALAGGQGNMQSGTGNEE